MMTAMFFTYSILFHFTSKLPPVRTNFDILNHPYLYIITRCIYRMDGVP